MWARVLAFTLLIGTAGCSAGQHRPASVPVRQSLSPRVLVFAVDGAGNFQGSSKALKAYVAEENIPIHVETYDWSHGYRRIFADHLDADHARKEGVRLAEAIRCYQQPTEGPPLPIVIVAHSAGCHVALSAASHLPPDCVERVLLLAPSVSEDYDIRPALRCSRKGVDVFHSHRDRTYLGFGMRLFGTSDRRRSAASGRVGFKVPDEPSEEGAVLYTRLRQHPWQENLRSTGNDGGHYGIYQPGYLKAFIVPLILSAGSEAGTPMP